MPSIIMPTIMSWNVARAAGPRLDAVAALVTAYRPDLLLLQEAVEDCRRLPDLLGGGTLAYRPAFPLARPRCGARSEGMALWSPHGLESPDSVRLGGWPWPRVAQWCRLGGWTVCNLHLSHLPWQGRSQLVSIASRLPRPTLLAGDLNRPGGYRLAGFRTLVPPGWSFRRGPLRLRLDAALLSDGAAGAQARYLDAGASDHRPLLLTFAEAASPHT
ncbi:MAG: endonuclease/exonuclease/phosphatase family protein [Alphaproteobacteria bacterium]